MRRLFSRLAALLTANAALYVALVWTGEACRGPGFDPGARNAVLYGVPEARTVDLLVAGSSQGWDLSRDHNHERVEAALGMSMVNISKRGGGLIPAKALVRHFYERGNRARAFALFAPEFIFYTRGLNEDVPFLNNEPLRLGMLKVALRHRLKAQVIYSYLSRRLSPGAVLSREAAKPRDDARLGALTARQARADIEWLYRNGRLPADFERYAREAVDIIAIAQGHGSRVVLVIPPMLIHLDETQGRSNRWREFMRDCQRRYGARVLDASEAVKQYRLFSDPVHLNTDGVEYFAANLLKPALEAPSGPGAGPGGAPQGAP